jgi:hypothetical protein
MGWVGLGRMGRVAVLLDGVCCGGVGSSGPSMCVTSVYMGVISVFWSVWYHVFVEHGQELVWQCATDRDQW